jgi:hypothetical protein
MMRMANWFILLIMILAIPGTSQGESPEGEKANSQVRMFQATLLGGGLALISSAIIFEGRDESYDTYFVENGTGDYIVIPRERGVDTSTLFWTGTAFMAVAALLELLPEGSSVGEEFRIRGNSRPVNGMHLKPALFRDGSSGICLAGEF